MMSTAIPGFSLQWSSPWVTTTSFSLSHSLFGSLRPSASSRQRFDSVFGAVGQLQPATPRQTALMPEIWSRVNEMVKLRRERLEASQAQVPSTLWIAVLVGTLLSLAPTYVLPCTAFNRLAIAMLSLSIGLVFFFVAAMDRPFAGAESIGPEPFERSLAAMARWDTEARR